MDPSIKRRAGLAITKQGIVALTRMIKPLVPDVFGNRNTYPEKLTVFSVSECVHIP